LSVPVIDQQLGLEVYLTKTAGIGGIIRKTVEDFVVEEILLGGFKATIKKEVSIKSALGATAGQQRFLLCVLVKRNWDMLMAVKNVARELGIDQGRIQIAGIKDAKAISAQYITLDGLLIEDAAKVQYKDIELRPLGYFREPLSAFYLLGNNFNINISSISQPLAVVEEQITRTIEEVVAVGGIPNFYGHQRFGTTRPITHLVGKALVQGNIEEAAMIFLAKPSPDEHPTSMVARKELQESLDFKRALAAFPSQLRYERLMLAHLAEVPEDFVGAFRCLPLKLRMLFVQAYQSLLFNRFLSERIRRGFSLGNAEAGDFVVNVERSGLPMIRTGKIVDQTMLEEVNGLIRAGKMRVALPIIGFSQRLSQGEIGEIQHNILAAEGIALNDFRVEAFPEINGKGELRAIVAPVKDFRAKSVEPESESSSTFKAGLEFMLFRGSYATVLLREVMKPKNLITAGF
jgi:tRNA pseudouridine13 synthase